MNTEKKKILIIEDDSNFGNILKDYLILNDYQVVLAKNGIDGMEKFLNESFDLCILDVMMPEMDGYEVLLTTVCGAKGLEWLRVELLDRFGSSRL